MPGFNQTGPQGQGPMTGRRLGRCTNFGMNVKENEERSNSQIDNDQIPQIPQRQFGAGMMNRFGKGRGPNCNRRGGRNRFGG